MEDPIDELFSSDPAEFTAARDALAKRLRADGEKDRAAQVKALRRPTAAAWAVNQVARRHPQLVDDVREAGRALERSQRRMLSGLRDAGMAEATRARREAVDAAVAAAGDLLASAGTKPDAHQDKLRATFEAASLGGDALDAVRDGRLAKELPPPSGFGGLAGLELIPGADEPASDATPSPEEDAGDAEQDAADDEDVALARAAVADARERAAEAVGRARTARRHAEELERARDDAEEEAAALERAAQDARRRADGLAADLEDAREDERRLADLARRRADDVREAEQRLPQG